MLSVWLGLVQFWRLETDEEKKNIREGFEYDLQRNGCKSKADRDQVR